MVFGALLALVGVVLFAKRGVEGHNRIKFLGMEFQLAGSSLVIFVLGVILFILPFVRHGDFPQIDENIGPVEVNDTPQEIDGLDAHQWHRKGIALWLNNEYSDPALAVTCYTNAISLKPLFADAYHGRAQAHHELKEYRKALEDIMQAISINPSAGRYYNEYAFILRDQGEHDRACEKWRRGIELGDKHSITNLSLYCP